MDTFCVGRYNSQNVSFKSSITDSEIENLKQAKQSLSDCYLMAGLEALTNTENGKKILKTQIQHSDTNPGYIECYLYKDGKGEKFSVPSASAASGYEKLYEVQDNEIVRALDVSIGEYEKKYKAKPLFCRIGDKLKTYKFEYNTVSHFFKTLTNKTPYSIGEMDFNLNLKGYKKEIMPLLERMDKEKDFSFVMGTGLSFRKDFRSWHVFMVESVDLANNKIVVKEKRTNVAQTLSIDEALSSFKYITGYFNSDLEK